MRTFLLLPLLLLPVAADTVVLKGGLRVEGEVNEREGSVVVRRGGREWVFPEDRVVEILRGRTAREEYEARAAALDGKDAAGWYRLALWAREKGLAQVRTALEAVLRAEPDHRAARRELGFERVGEEWLSGDEAMQRKGFVLAAGDWVLPEEAERRLRDGGTGAGTVTEEQRLRAEAIVAALSDEDAAVRAAAAEQMGEVPAAALVRPLRKALYAPSPETRELAVGALGNAGDKIALPWLIRTSMYDASATVRAAAIRAIKGFGDDDVFYPYARALFSASDAARLHATDALARLADLRGVDVILRRVSIGIGASGRSNIFVGKQESYIQDFDVEIAQAAAIGDPIVQTIRDGVVLDYKILGGSGEGYIVERKGYARALASLTGRDFGEDFQAYARYAQEMGYPKANLRGDLR